VVTTKKIMYLKKQTRKI